MGSNEKVTLERKWHLRNVIGIEAFIASRSKCLVYNWIQHLKLLSITVESEPQSAYSAFVGGFKGKCTYFMRTIPSLGEL